ncbi:XRE family transcriptional regulator [Fontibacillus sp. BL9]|uniref:XRE family transcriptional regulator n=1 Tax=Fontibacillus sp. BL9 TaxID=3389971 RepID=UPI003979AF68
MNSVSAIRSLIYHQIESKGFNLNSLSNRSGINRGTLSAILNGNPPRPISIGQLDLITEALEQPRGKFYSLYIDECVDTVQPNRRRLKSFLLRCADIGELECINRVLTRLMEDLSYIPLIFDIAEQLYGEKKYEASRPFYNAVVDSEKYQHAERLAISQYRLFRLALGDDMEQNLLASNRFEPYRKRLPEDYQLEALLHLANVYYTLQKWDRVLVYADELRDLAKAVYKDYERAFLERKPFELRCERHLVVYYGQGYLLKGNALEHQRHYEASAKYIEGYADLSWFVGLNDLGKQEVEKFKLFAKLNLFNLEVLQGNKYILPAYVQLLKEHPYELLPSLRTIIEAANINGFFIDDLLNQFQIDTSLYMQFDNYYLSVMNKDRYLDLCYNLIVYSLRKKDNMEAMEKIIYSLKYSISINNKEHFMKIVPLFEQYRAYASKEQLKEYESIMEGVLKNAEMGVGLSACD